MGPLSRNTKHYFFIFCNLESGEQHKEDLSLLYLSKPFHSPDIPKRSLCQRAFGAPLGLSYAFRKLFCVCTYMVSNTTLIFLPRANHPFFKAHPSFFDTGSHRRSLWSTVTAIYQQQNGFSYKCLFCNLAYTNEKSFCSAFCPIWKGSEHKV